MRKICALLTLALGVAISAPAQGFVSMNTVSPGSYLRYIDEFTGLGVPGDACVAGLYWASDYATLATGGGTLVQSRGTNNTGLAIFGNGNAAGYVISSTFGGNRAIPERAGQVTYFQLRAWSAGFSSYEEAQQATGSGVRVSMAVGSYAPPIVTAVPTLSVIDPPTIIRWAPGTTGQNPDLVCFLTTPARSTILVPEPGFLLFLGGLLPLFLRQIRKARSS